MVYFENILFESISNTSLGVEIEEKQVSIDNPETLMSFSRLKNTIFKEDWVTVSFQFEASPEQVDILQINLFDDRSSIVCSISSSGKILDSGVSEFINCTKISDNRFLLNVIFYNVSNFIHIGTLSNKLLSSMSHLSQYKIYNLEILLNRPDMIDEDKILTYIDVGARWGRTYELKQERRNVQLVMFEPDPDATFPLIEESKKYKNTKIMQYALADTNSTRNLYVTKGAPCSSLLVPNNNFLSKYEIGSSYEIDKVIKVNCKRYDSLYFNNEVPIPDAVKIDVQGFEMNVLEGFGDLLSNCLGIELETHIYPIYHQQKLLTDIVAFLEKFDFILTKLQPQKNFGDELIEFNAWFLKRSDWLREQPSNVHFKMKTLKKVWFF